MYILWYIESTISLKLIQILNYILNNYRIFYLAAGELEISEKRLQVQHGRRAKMVNLSDVKPAALSRRRSQNFSGFRVCPVSEATCRSPNPDLPVEPVPRLDHRPPYKIPPSSPHNPTVSLFPQASCLLQTKAHETRSTIRSREFFGSYTNPSTIICLSSPLASRRSENRAAKTTPQMVFRPTMVTEAEVSMQYKLHVSKKPAAVNQIDAESSPILGEARVADSVSAEFTRLDSVRSDLLIFSRLWFPVICN